MAKQTTLKNGMQLIQVGMPNTPTASIHLSFEAGAGSETAEENGIAHFLEHLVFKGGKTFDSEKEIDWAAENLGAALNAYTSHDVVSFHITGRASQAADLTALLTDFVASPKLKQADIDTERGVVIQEIARKDDDPETLAYLMMDEAAYGPDNSLGRSVLGPKEHITNFTREQIVSFRNRQWAPNKGAVVIVGDIAPSELKRIKELIENIVVDTSKAKASHLVAPDVERRVIVKSDDTEQSHLRLYWHLNDYHYHGLPQRAAMEVYARLLGGGLGSRLGNEIRVKRGLCYNIYASDETHPNCAGIYVSSGLQSDRCLEAYGLINTIVNDLADNGPDVDEVQRAKAGVVGTTLRYFEKSSNVATSATEGYFLHGQVDSPDEIVAAIDKVTIEDVTEIAEKIKGLPSVGCIGPHKQSDFQCTPGGADC